MSMASPSWDRKRAAHLYRRAGFGGRPEDLDRAVSLGREGAVSHLVDYDGISTADLDAYLDTFGFDLAGYQEGINGERGSFLIRWWYLRMQHGPRPLQEKMTLFWHNHFATSFAKVVDEQLMYAQNQIFRNLGMGQFEDLLLAVSRDPAMLIWLDNASNVKDSPNENFAREVMELFTMGHGNYTQQDVTGAARSFTGWTIDSAKHNRFYFDPNAHDDSVKYFLGQYGDFEGEDIIAALGRRPETAAFITGKLARFFLGGDPSPALAQRLRDMYPIGIREIVREILLSDDFDQTADAPDMIKSPMELVVGAYRSLGAESDAADYDNYSAAMGQNPFYPPNVGGWKGGRTWIHTQAYLMRINFAFDLVHQTARRGDVAAFSNFRWDISRFFEDRSFSTPDELIDFLVDRLGMVTPSDSVRQALRGFLAVDGDPFAWGPDSFDYDFLGRGAIYLLMSSPEYQLQ
jgi:Protein of unknown function (DUF1800)